MNDQQVSAYNEQHKLAGKPNELLHVVNPSSGKKDIMTRKQLSRAGKTGWKEYDPAKPPIINAPQLSDDILKLEAEKKALEVQNLQLALDRNELEARLRALEENGHGDAILTISAPVAMDSVAIEPERRPRGRPRKQPVDA